MKDKLQELGLTEREAEAYLALFNFDETTATELAKITKEHRTNIYDSLNGLIKKGLIAYNIKNNVKHYFVSNPEKLLDYIIANRLYKKKLEEFIKKLKILDPFELQNYN